MNEQDKHNRRKLLKNMARAGVLAGLFSVGYVAAKPGSARFVSSLAESDGNGAKNGGLRRATEADGAGTDGDGGRAAGSGGLRTLWQIDPEKCTYCGKCSEMCVLHQSAVKCLHKSDICGYCDLCTGYFYPEPSNLDTAAENQVCPTGAIARRFVEEPYFQYAIDHDLCIGCAKCVEGCSKFGNGSLYLQIMHDRCLNCNECAIAVQCQSSAIIRVPEDRPYFYKTV